MTTATRLIECKTNPDDEFYTDIAEVEDMLKPNLNALKGKKILLPCDCPDSAFYKYLNQNAPEGSVIRSRYYMDEGNWDMTAPMANPYYDWCDVVITNPPFSLLANTIYPKIVEAKKLATLMIVPLTTVGYKSVAKMIAEGHAKVVRNVNHAYVRPDGSKKSIGTVWLATYGAMDLFKDQRPELDPNNGLLSDNYRVTDEGIVEYSKIKDINIHKTINQIAVPISILAKNYNKLFKLSEIGRLHLNGKSLFQRAILERI